MACAATVKSDTNIFFREGLSLMAKRIPMKFNRFDRLAVLVCLCAGFLACMTAAADKIRPEIKTERVLFLGNSITRHGVLEKIGCSFIFASKSYEASPRLSLLQLAKMCRR